MAQFCLRQQVSVRQALKFFEAKFSRRNGDLKPMSEQRKQFYVSQYNLIAEKNLRILAFVE